MLSHCGLDLRVPNDADVEYVSTCLLGIWTLSLKKRLSKWPCMLRFVDSERSGSTFWVTKSSPRSWAPQRPILVAFVMHRLGGRHCYKSCLTVGETEAWES